MKDKKIEENIIKEVILKGRRDIFIPFESTVKVIFYDPHGEHAEKCYEHTEKIRKKHLKAKNK